MSYSTASAPSADTAELVWIFVITDRTQTPRQERFSGLQSGPARLLSLHSKLQTCLLWESSSTGPRLLITCQYDSDSVATELRIAKDQTDIVQELVEALARNKVQVETYQTRMVEDASFTPDFADIGTLMYEQAKLQRELATIRQKNTWHIPIERTTHTYTLEPNEQIDILVDSLDLDARIQWNSSWILTRSPDASIVTSASTIPAAIVQQNHTKWLSVRGQCFSCGAAGILLQPCAKQHSVHATGVPYLFCRDHIRLVNCRYDPGLYCTRFCSGSCTCD